MRGSTFLLRPSNSDRRNVGKISIFSLSPLSICFPLLFLSLFASLPPLFNAFLPLFAPHPISFSFSFSLFSHFRISFFSLSFLSFLSFSLLPLFYFSFRFFFLNRIYQSGGNSPLPHFPLSHLSSPCIFLIFLYFFSFSLLHHSTHGLM